MNLFSILQDSEPHYRDKPFLRFEDRDLGYGEFRRLVDRIAGELTRRELAQGDRVVLLAHNSPHWLAAVFAVAAKGGVVVPVNASLSKGEVDTIVAHSGARIAFVGESLTDLVDARHGVATVGLPLDPADRDVAPVEPVDLDTEAPCFIFYTSGTTGTPKGVVLSVRAEMFIATMLSGHLALTSADVSLICGPLPFIFHVVLNALSAIKAGASMVMLARFKPDVALKAIEESGVTLTMGVPTMYLMMLEAFETRPADLSSMRFAICGGASLPDSLRRKVQAGLGFPLFDLWGMTECTPVTSYDPRIDRESRANSCGRALPGCAVKIVDGDLNDLPAGEIGEILLRSPALMTGYYRNPEATAATMAGDWLKSGDLGTIDADGFLSVVGRKKDLIIRGGANIYAVDVETALYQHRGVGECAVIGIPDERYGEAVKAFVVPKDECSLTAEEVIAHCRSLLADYKTPSHVEFVDALPRGPTGKILLRKLRDPA